MRINVYAVRSSERVTCIFCERANQDKISHELIKRFIYTLIVDAVVVVVVYCCCDYAAVYARSNSGNRNEHRARAHTLTRTQTSYIFLIFNLRKSIRTTDIYYYIYIYPYQIENISLPCILSSIVHLRVQMKAYCCVAVGYIHIFGDRCIWADFRNRLIRNDMHGIIFYYVLRLIAGYGKVRPNRIRLRCCSHLPTQVFSKQFRDCKTVTS